ncbi:SDR family oxidoreductase [bacterium]|nr:SDR family oxidoreductase [bacterium]
MRALVLGASGQIGGHLLAQLLERGHAAVGTRRAFAASGLPELDIAREDAVRAAIDDVRPDAVLLPAGFTWVDGCEKDPARSALENRERPLAVARLAARAGAVFVYYSTDYVFDGTSGPYSESDPTAPLQVYGRDKLACEEALAREGLPHLVLRTTTVFGPELQGKNFVLQLVAKARAGERLKVPRDQLATPSFSPDGARATIELLEAGERGVFHVAGPDLHDRASFASLACEVLGLDTKTVEPVETAALAQPAKRPLRAGLVSEKLAEKTGFRLRSAREGLVATKSWLALSSKNERS